MTREREIPRLASTALALLLVSSCTEVVTPPAPVVPRMAAQAGGTPLTLAVNQVVTPTPSVRVTDDAGLPLAGVRVVFAPTRGPGVVTGPEVVTGADGIATVGSWRYGVRPGAQELTAAIVSATVDERVVFSGTAVVGPTESVIATPSTVMRAPGLTQQLTVNAFDAFGNTVGTNVVAGYVSLDTTIATVSASGLVSTVAVGITAVIASFQGRADTVPVVVGLRPTGTDVVNAALAQRPYVVAISPQGTAYAGRIDAANLTRYSLPSVGSLGTIPLVGGAYDVTFLPTGNRAYAVNTAALQMSVIDAATHTVLRTIAGIGEPYRVRSAPGGDYVFVSTPTGDLRRINTTTDAIETISPGGILNGLAVNASRGVLYASSTTGEIFEVSLTTFAVLRSASLGGTPQGMAVSGDGNTIFVANESAGVQVVDAATLGVTQTVAGTGGAFDVALTLDGVELYVSRSQAGTVNVIDVATRAIIRSHPGGAPRRMAFSPDGLVLVVANEAGWLTFIR